MTEVNVEDVTAALEATRVSQNGVTFEGRSLKLNTEEDAKEVVDAINNATDLGYLNMEGNTLGVDAATAIAKALEKHPELKRALWKDMFTGRMKTEIPKALQSLGTGLVTAGAQLAELDLSDNAFGPIGVEGLAALLRSSSCYGLEELKLNNNGLGITGGKLLAAALLDCYQSSKRRGKALGLKVFIAGRNRLENEGAKALAEVFKILGTLEEITMPQNGIYFEGISALSQAFIQNKNLEVLNLNDNTIRSTGARAIAAALPNLQNLKVINFGDCLLKTKGALVLAKALQNDHKQLEELVLSSNEIKLDGGIALIDAIMNKPKLKSFVLEGNQFGTAAISRLKIKMTEIGKINTLGPLEECESEVDDSEEENESDKSDTENENDVEIAPLEEVSENIQDFLKNPTVSSFTNLGDKQFELILNALKSDPDYMNSMLLLLVKIASFANNNQAKVANPALKCSNELLKELFTWANKNYVLPLLNNSILVYLGLIKSEDKTFKIQWDVENCLITLSKIVNSSWIPNETKQMLKVFTERNIDNTEFQSAKKKLLSALQ